MLSSSARRYLLEDRSYFMVAVSPLAQDIKPQVNLSVRSEFDGIHNKINEVRSQKTVVRIQNITTTNSFTKMSNPDLQSMYWLTGARRTG